MTSHDIDKLLEHAFSGEPPGGDFRARVLLESTAALARARRGRSRWRLVALSAAAVFVAAVSFLVGRYSVPVSEPQSAAGPMTAEASATVPVPNELVEWLEAAQLFRQLGMADRMARAVERASRLVPRDAATVPDATGPVFARGVSTESQQAPAELVGAPDSSIATANRILARSFGD